LDITMPFLLERAGRGLKIDGGSGKAETPVVSLTKEEAEAPLGRHGDLKLDRDCDPDVHKS
jgi:hypothetical protein